MKIMVRIENETTQTGGWKKEALRSLHLKCQSQIQMVQKLWRSGSSRAGLDDRLDWRTSLAPSLNFVDMGFVDLNSDDNFVGRDQLAFK